MSTSSRRKPTASEIAAIRDRIAGLSREEKLELAARTKPIVDKRQATGGSNDEVTRAPTTDDELHAAIIRETGFDIPRVAVCEDHCAPFDPIADGFFHRQPGILILKSREAGGTLNASILQYMLCKYMPGHEGVTFGAIETQAAKAFEYVKKFVEERTKDGIRQTKPEIAGEPLRKRITWKIGSMLSIIIATVSGVNSPHPNTAHADELDLMDEAVLAQAANMAQPLDCSIATPHGWAYMGDVNVGDEVIGLDGLAHIVLNVWDLGKRETYEVTLSDGRKTRCALGHKWFVGWRGFKSERWGVKTVEEIIEDYQKPRFGQKYMTYRYFLPSQEVIEYSDDFASLPIDPYVLGVLLGDGCIRNRKANFRADDREIVRLVSERVGEGLYVRESVLLDGPSMYHITQGKAGKSGIPNPLVVALETLGLEGCNSHTKFIPDLYLFASPSERLEMLRGLMDTDGHAGQSPRYASVSWGLASGVSQKIGRAHV